jgi:TPR repeat protein
MKNNHGQILVIGIWMMLPSFVTCNYAATFNSASAHISVDSSTSAINTQSTRDNLFMQSQQAARSGDAKDQYTLGMLYLQGRGIKRNVEKAIDWLGKAAQHGQVDAQYQMGIVYRDGVGIKKNEQEAIKWFRLAATWGNELAQAALDELLTKQIKTTQTNLRQAAKQGDPEAQYYLARMYVLGTGGYKNMRLAVKWFQKSAALGHAKSQYELGMLYKNGVYVPHDKKQAKMWLVKSLENGFDKAKVILQDIVLEEQRQLNNNRQRVFSYTPEIPFQNAAKEGNIDAQFKLGMLFIKGDVTERKPAEGIKWLRKAAQRDYLAAQIKLGELYLKGIDVKTDFTEAAKWFQKAAKQGDADAQYILANMYSKGLGLERSNKEARKWFRAAADQGHLKAKAKLVNE